MLNLFVLSGFLRNQSLLSRYSEDSAGKDVLGK
jgi:hypothetical protein